MPFTVSWYPLSAGDLDPDSPITTEVAQAWYYNTDFVSEWVGDRTAAAVNHRHRGLGVDGTDAVAYGDISGGPSFNPYCAREYFVLGWTESGITAPVAHSTGALTLSPSFAFCHVMVMHTDGDTLSTGFIFGTGASSHAQFWDPAGGTFGQLASAAGRDHATSHDLDVSAFSSAGISFLMAGAPGLGKTRDVDVQVTVIERDP